MGDYLAAPEGRTTFTIKNHPLQGARTRHRLYVYGDDDRVINPGDLLIVSTIGAGTGYEAVVETYFSGNEVHHLAEVAFACAAERDRNSWLSESSTRIVDGAA